MFGLHIPSPCYTVCTKLVLLNHSPCGKESGGAMSQCKFQDVLNDKVRQSPWGSQRVQTIMKVSLLFQWMQHVTSLPCWSTPLVDVKEGSWG